MQLLYNSIIVGHIGKLITEPLAVENRLCSLSSAHFKSALSCVH